MEDIINYLCNKHGMSRVAIKAICDSPFRFISEEMRSGEFKNFNMLGLGKFAVKSKYKDPQALEEFKIKHNVKNRRDSGRLEEPGLERSSD